MGVKVTNNAYGTLSAGIASGDTTITLDGGQGARFPTLGAGDYFYGTLVDTSNNIEVVKVTARSTDSMTVVRGQDNTTARAYVIGDRFELRPTAALFNDIALGAELVNDTTPQLGGNLDFNGNSVSTTADFDTSSGPAITIGGGYSGGALGAVTATPFNDASFQRIELNDQHTATSEFTDPDNWGPNKISFYDDATWKGGFGLGSATMGYFSGAAHRFYKHGGTSVTEHLAIDTNGYVITPKQPHLLCKTYRGSGAGYYSLTAKSSRNWSVGSYGGADAWIIPVSGVYTVQFSMIVASGSGRRDIIIRKNGTTFMSTLTPDNETGYGYRSSSATYYFTTGDAVQVYLNSGSSYYTSGTSADHEWGHMSLALIS